MIAVLVSAMGAFFAPAGMNASRADVSALVVESNGNLDKLDITTGMSTVLSNSGQVYFGLAFNSNETVLYGIVGPSVGATTSLVTINPMTGADTPVGSNGVALTTITNLANGQLFGVDINDNLYSINPTTGAATLVGATGLPSLSGIGFDNSLASNGTSLYYTLDTSSGINSTLYTLNMTTGAATAVGPTGMNGIIGSAFAGPTFGTGQLYGFDSNGNTDVINLSTGAATVLNSNGLSDIFGGVGIVTAAAAVPELPTSVMTLVCGSMGLLWHVGRRLKRRECV
jgi:hypothetical protein